MNTVGKIIKLTFFGESHSEYMGITIDGIKSGILINQDLIRLNLTKRQPKKDINTSRIEDDNYNFITGLKDNITTGAPLTVLIKNNRFDSKEYPNLNETPRPSHADYPAFIKFNGYNDYFGGGMFSGRLTVLWIIIGSIAQQLLEEKGIYIGSHIYSIHNIHDDLFDSIQISKDLIKKLNQEDIPLMNHSLEAIIREKIKDTMNKNDSIGGIIESAIIHLPIGIGQPLFHSIESYLSYLLFSIPGVKGIEFGSGFDITKLYGSEANDSYYYDNKDLKLKTNHNGGVLGGLSNGAPIIIRTAIKPIASIKKPQETINTKTKTNTIIELNGRHDPQILTRVHSVINAVLNYGILDLLYEETI